MAGLRNDRECLSGINFRPRSGLCDPQPLRHMRCAAARWLNRTRRRVAHAADRWFGRGHRCADRLFGSSHQIQRPPLATGQGQRTLPGGAPGSGRLWWTRSATRRRFCPRWVPSCRRPSRCRPVSAARSSSLWPRATDVLPAAKACPGSSSYLPKFDGLRLVINCGAARVCGCGAAAARSGPGHAALLPMFASERWLSRLAASPHRSRFVLI